MRGLAALALAASLGLMGPGTPEPRPDDTARAPSAAPAAATDGSVQRAVNYAFSQVLPDAQVAFALASAQSSRVEGGGRRFEGAGIGTWANGEARFVSFVMTLSARGELVEFDYGASPDSRGDQAPALVAEN